MQYYVSLKYRYKVNGMGVQATTWHDVIMQCNYIRLWA